MSNQELPIKPDKVTLELLSRAKLFLEHAHSHASTSSTLDRMVAIHGMDNAIEFLLRIVSRHIEFESIENKRLPNDLAGMAGELNKFLNKHYNYRISYLDDIKLLRKIRNLVQHGASDPAPEMERLISFTTRFFKKTVENLFGLNPSNLELSQLITNKDIRDHLARAEELLLKKKYLESIVASRDAFENAFFKKKIDNRIRLDPSPILADFKKGDSVFSQYFYREASNLIQINSLGINFNKFERYQEIIDHIPSKYRADSSGHVVMQRPWEKVDANFIYGFVAQQIYKWQTEELDPLYERDSSFEGYEIEETIGGIKLTEAAPSFIYFDSGQDLRIHYVNTEIKQKLSKLESGKSYSFNAIHTNKSVKELEIQFDIKLKKILFNLETNNPPRWEVIINFVTIPLTWHRKEFKNGKLVKESPSINSDSISELIKIDHIGKATADKIISFRKKNGDLKNSKDLKKIKGLNKKQFDEISNYTRI